VSRDIYVLWSGRARIALADVSEVFIELSDGDVFGVVSRSRDRAAAQEVIAVTDCEVVRIDGSTAGAIASRNPTLADELNQLLASRNRRLDPPTATVGIGPSALDQDPIEVRTTVVVEDEGPHEGEPAS
jgi:CRP-like cAMP-binding protein